MKTENLHSTKPQRMISLKKMCQQTGIPGLFSMIRNCIGLYCREHSDLWTHIYTNKNDKSDIYLTTDGVCVFSSILNEYFGEKEIDLLQRDLRKG